jgi:hypothetical protein
MHTVIYDISTCPNGISMEMLMELYESSGIILWDSRLFDGQLSGGIGDGSPKVTLDESCDKVIKIIDCGK